MKYFAILTLLAGITFPLNAEIAVPHLQETERLLQSSDKLKESWEKEKEHYSKGFENQLKAIEEQLKKVEKELDHGDRKRRDELNQQIYRLWFARDEMKRKVTELKAATAVDWASIKAEIDAFIQENKAKITGTMTPKEH